MIQHINFAKKIFLNGITPCVNEGLNAITYEGDAPSMGLRWKLILR